MKNKNAELLTYILISVISIIILGFLIYQLVIYARSTSEATNHIVEKAQKQIYDYADSDLTMYDGETIKGSEVSNFIKEQLGNYSYGERAPIYVKVTTVVSGSTYINTYLNSQYISNIKDFSSTQYYIKPTAYFQGSVVKSTNQAILGVTFLQK